MIVCIPAMPDGTIGPSWGRAARVALVRVEDGAITAVDEHDVGWDVLHDVGTEGGHHARVARFLTDHAVDAVVADHMGPPMMRMLGEMGIRTRLGVGGDLREAAISSSADTG